MSSPDNSRSSRSSRSRTFNIDFVSEKAGPSKQDAALLFLFILELSSCAPISSSPEATSSPEAAGNTESATLETGIAKTDALEVEFDDFMEEEGKIAGDVTGHILNVNGEETRFVTTSVIKSESGQVISGGEIWKLSESGSWKKLEKQSVTATVQEAYDALEAHSSSSDEERAPFEQEVVSVESLKKSLAPILKGNEFGITADDLEKVDHVYILDSENDPREILRETRITFSNENGSLVLAARYAGVEDTNQDGLADKLLPLKWVDYTDEFKIVANSVTTDAGAMAFVQGNEKKETVMVVADELVDSIKGKNPVVEGDQIINGATGEVLLVNVDGKWQKVDVAEAVEDVAEDTVEAEVEESDTTEPEVQLSPEQITLMEEAQAILPETLFYGLEVSFSGENLVAHSPLDAADSPHYSYVEGEWVDNHPGRNAMEEELFPAVQEDGTSIWENLERDGAVWDQDMMAYHYVNSPDADPGHEQYYQPLMAVRDRDPMGDIEGGDVYHAETVESDDFVLGESGVKIDFYISADHQYVKWWENLPKDIASQVFAEMYLEKFPDLKGKHVQVRVVAEDKTHRGDSVREDTFFQGDYVSRLDSWQTGVVDVEGVDELMLVTLSISTDGLEGHELRFVGAPHNAFIWSQIVNRDGQIKVGGHGMDAINFEIEARQKIAENAGIDIMETGRVETK